MECWLPDDRREGRPSSADRDFWIAMHYRLIRKRGQYAAAALEVAQSWMMKRADDVEKIERRFRGDCELMEARIPRDSVAAMVERRTPKSGRGIN
jgi:hypothetical protein